LDGKEEGSIHVDGGDGFAVLLKVLKIDMQVSGRGVDLIFGWINAIDEEVVREHQLQMKVGAKRLDGVSDIGVCNLDVAHVLGRLDLYVDILVSVERVATTINDGKTLTGEVVRFDQRKHAKRRVGLQDEVVELPILLQSGIHGRKVRDHDVVLFKRI